MKNFSQILNPLIRDNKIPDGVFRTYLVLKTYQFGNSNVFPSQETLAKIRGKSKKSIINHLKTLKSIGLLSYRKRGFSASNIYSFIGESNYTNEDINNNNKILSIEKNNSPLLLQELQSNNTKINNNKIDNIDEFQNEVVSKGLKKILEENSFIKEHRTRLLEKTRIK